MSFMHHPVEFWCVPCSTNSVHASKDPLWITQSELSCGIWNLLYFRTTDLT